MRVSKARKSFLFVLLAAFLWVGIRGIGESEESLSVRGRTQTDLPAAPFSPGEKLTFRVIYFALPAGTVVMEVKKVSSWEGHRVYQLVATARSSSLFSLFYRVKDRLDSLIDTKTFLPYRFEKHQEEGKYRNKETTLFDRDKNVAVTFDAEEKETNPKGTSIPVPPDVQDALSVFYHLRRQKLIVGKPVLVNVNADGKNYRIEVKVLRKEKLGSQKTIVIEPILKQVDLGGILKEKGGIYIWLSDDERRIPVLIKSRVVIGSLTLMLVDEKLGQRGVNER